MENGWSNRGGQNGTFQPIWDLWDSSSSSRLLWNCNTPDEIHSLNQQTAFAAGAGEISNLIIHQTTGGFGGGGIDHHHHHHRFYEGPSLSRPWQYPDPHLMCLNLGKRHYFEDPDRHMSVDLSAVAAAAAAKRGKSGGCGGAATAVVPRCQVEGCHVALGNAKGYHKRHKVCEMHSKAPKVTVLGEDQRFCQQCSRFHGVGEFDETKRSCRRRLAGHNERRRKGSHDSMPRNSNQGRAFSLLSSSSSSSSRPRPEESWCLTSVDLSSRCSAALRDLIAENRATASILYQQQQQQNINYHNTQEESHDTSTNCTIKFSQNHPMYDHEVVQPEITDVGFRVRDHVMNEPAGGGTGAGSHLTLDLMQPTSSGSGSAFGFYLS